MHNISIHKNSTSAEKDKSDRQYRHARIAMKLMKKRAMPGPGTYDNFKMFDDTCKWRSYTMGRRYTRKDKKSANSPGPAKYNISKATKFSDNGGPGQNTNKHWRFGTQ